MFCPGQRWILTMQKASIVAETFNFFIQTLKHPEINRHELWKSAPVHRQIQEKSNSISGKSSDTVNFNFDNEFASVGDEPILQTAGLFIDRIFLFLRPKIQRELKSSRCRYPAFSLCIHALNLFCRGCGTQTMYFNISVMYNPFVAYSTPFAYINYPICSRAIAVMPSPDNFIPTIKHIAELQSSSHSNKLFWESQPYQ